MKGSRNCNENSDYLFICFLYSRNLYNKILYNRNRKFLFFINIESIKSFVEKELGEIRYEYMGKEKNDVEIKNL